MDLVTGIALITLLFMMLQTEHERCDRVRAGWREVRRATFAATSAIQLAKKMQGHANLEQAQASCQELYSTVLLYGKGNLKKEYQKQLTEKIKKGALTPLLPIFQELDGKTEMKFATWRLRWL
jgi:hypothetical protein